MAERHPRYRGAFAPLGQCTVNWFIWSLFIINPFLGPWVFIISDSDCSIFSISISLPVTKQWYCFFLCPVVRIGTDFTPTKSTVMSLGMLNQIALSSMVIMLLGWYSFWIRSDLTYKMNSQAWVWLTLVNSGTMSSSSLRWYCVGRRNSVTIPSKLRKSHIQPLTLRSGYCWSSMAFVCNIFLVTRRLVFGTVWGDIERFEVVVVPVGQRVTILSEES